MPRQSSFLPALLAPGGETPSARPAPRRPSPGGDRTLSGLTETADFDGGGLKDVIGDIPCCRFS